MNKKELVKVITLSGLGSAIFVTGTFKLCEVVTKKAIDILGVDHKLIKR